MSEEATKQQPAVQPQADRPTETDKPNPTDAMIAAQEAIEKSRPPSAFDEIDILAKGPQQKPPPQQKEKPKAKQPKQPEKKTAKPQHQRGEPQKSESVEIGDIKGSSPEETAIAEFLDPDGKPEEPSADDEPEGDSEDSEEADVQEVDAEDKPEQQKKKPIAALREAYDKNKKRLKQLEEEVEKLRLGEHEDSAAKKLKTKLEESEKRILELEGHLKYADFTKTTEYKKNYEQPLVDALKDAYETVADLDLFDGDDEDGNRTSSRKAAAEDFNSILGLNPSQAAIAAKKLFGDAGALEVLAHRRAVLEAKRKRESAVSDWEQNLKSSQEQSMKQAQEKRESLKKIWDDSNSDIVKKYPQLFAPVDGDEKANELLQQGYRVTDYALSNPNIPQEQLVRIHAMLRNKAAAFDSVVYRSRQEIAKLKDRVSELEKELGQYGESQPPASGIKRESQPNGDEKSDWESELDALAASNRR